MADKKILELDTRVPDGTEYFPVATLGANWKVLVADVLGGGGGTPGGNDTNVQFNNSGSFGGSADLEWVIDATNTTGLTIGDESGVGSSKSYNFVSKNSGYLATMASTVGGNLFQGHVAIGNYADVDFVTNSPGDPGSQFTFAAPVSLVINNFYDAPPTDGTYGIEVCDGLKHTAGGSANYNGIKVESVINGTSTGNWLNVFGLVFSPQNSGLSGDITNLVGMQGGPINFPTAGTVTHMEGARIRLVNGGAVTNAHGIRVLAPLNFGTVTNVYGLDLEDHSGIGSTASYNLLSRDSGYLGTMASTVGGNLFQGHSAFGSYADVDNYTWAPGDPAQTFTDAGFFTALINDAYQGSIGGFTPRSGLGIYLGYEHTGTGTLHASALQCFAHISTDSTSGVTELRALNFNIENFGSGAISGLLGVVGSIDQWGTADVTNATAVEGGITAGNGGGDIINARVFHANSVVKFGVGADAHNVYGLDLEDQSGIGSTLSLNMISRGSSSRNVFEGYIEQVETGTPPAGVTNHARIFTEDNGGGKTRLMVQFGSGAAQQIAIEP